GLIPKNSGWFLKEARGIDDAGRIVGVGTKPSGIDGAFLLTPTAGSSATSTASASSLTDAKPPGLAPVDDTAPSLRSRAVAPPSAPGSQGSPILDPLMPATDRDLAILATEVILTGAKRPPHRFWG